MSGQVVIDCFVHDFGGFRPGFATVAVDVIRATTMAVTAVTQGRRCYPVPTLDAAVERAEGLDDPLLAGELGGNMPYGFDMDNSPAALVQRTDTSRPLVLLSTSGTQLIGEAARVAPVVYAACLRNVTAQARHLQRYPRVALIGAGSRAEFREEDQLCCAWIAGQLIEAGHAADPATHAVVRRWQDQPVEALLVSNSVKYLRSTGREDDLEFVLRHVDDVDAVFRLEQDELVMRPADNYGE